MKCKRKITFQQQLYISFIRLERGKKLISDCIHTFSTAVAWSNIMDFISCRSEEALICIASASFVKASVAEMYVSVIFRTFESISSVTCWNLSDLLFCKKQCIIYNKSEFSFSLMSYIVFTSKERANVLFHAPELFLLLAHWSKNSLVQVF